MGARSARAHSFANDVHVRGSNVYARPCDTDLMDDPTLADDEATLRRYAADLADACDAVVGDWILGSIAMRATDLARSDQAQEAARTGAAAISGELRAMLELDIDDQRGGPLEILRRGVSFATEVLRDAGIAPATRDPFSVQNFPQDVYDLTPASFAAVDERLHEPGILWGAAKAHVHLRRRREANEPGR